MGRACWGQGACLLDLRIENSAENERAHILDNGLRIVREEGKG